MKDVYVGVDIGGTNTVIGVFDERLDLMDKTVIATTKRHFPMRTNNAGEFLDELANEIHHVLRKATPDCRLAGVGMGVPGKVTLDKE